MRTRDRIIQVKALLAANRSSLESLGADITLHSKALEMAGRVQANQLRREVALDDAIWHLETELAALQRKRTKRRKKR